MFSVIDVAVIGGGAAGAAAAIGLARAGLTVTLIDSNREPPLRVGETLPPKIRLCLEALELWDAFMATRPLACPGRRSSWGRAAPHEVSAIFDPYGPGWHVDRQRFDGMLLDAAARAGAAIIAGASAGAAERSGARWRICVSGGKSRTALTASFVIDASGRRAVFARRYGRAQRRAIDRMVALLAYLEAPVRIADDRTLVETTPQGWWYCAAIPENRVVAALMTDTDLLLPRGDRDSYGWARRLAAAPLTAARLAGCRVLGAPRLVSAESSRLDPVAGDGWLAVGDAAATLDPLSSAGVETALRSAIDAAGAIIARFAGDTRAVAAYATRREEEFARYLEQRRAYYAMERRWPDHSFWPRRAGSGLRPSEKSALQNA